MTVTKTNCREGRCWQFLQLLNQTKALLTVAVLCLLQLQTMANPSNYSPYYNDHAALFKPVKGKVTDKNGKALADVSVTVKSSGKGTATNAEGAFTIEAEKGDMLEFSIVGYKTVTVKVDNESAIEVVMERGASSLAEVVVVGFGTQKKTDLTGAVAQVNADRIQNRPVANLGQALQGLMPNLNVSVGNGNLNTKPSYNIRGGTSIALNSDNQWAVTTGSPLILVDGVPMDINQLNPEDIESVTMLKDAASAAIYGARGAFGVLLIKTKSGKKGERVSIDYSTLSSGAKLPLFLICSMRPPYSVPDRCGKNGKQITLYRYAEQTGFHQSLYGGSGEQVALFHEWSQYHLDRQRESLQRSPARFCSHAKT